MTTEALSTVPDALVLGLQAGRLIPYLGPAVLALCEGATPPAEPLALVGRLTARTSVPGKIRNRLTAAAQFIENFKHRRTLVQAMDEAYATAAVPSVLHRFVASLDAPLVVHTWYDDTMRRALADARGSDADAAWGEVQALSQSEHFGRWTTAFDAAGQAVEGGPAARWRTLLYRPWGGHAPASNYLVSDTDFVEVLTEIDIQTPIPDAVQALRATRGFVFMGCRFDDQLSRSYARQIMKRSAGPHWAVLPDEPTRMEARFLAEQDITRIALPLAEVADALAGVAA